MEPRPEDTLILFDMNSWLRYIGLNRLLSRLDCGRELPPFEDWAPPSRVYILIIFIWEILSLSCNSIFSSFRFAISLFFSLMMARYYSWLESRRLPEFVVGVSFFDYLSLCLGSF